MNLPDYHQFTEALVARLAADPAVHGVVALGSMASQDYQPDSFSDHDFFVVTEPGAQERFRADLSWLPPFGRIVLSYRETAHGLKVLSDAPHLLEFAVFDREELNLARVNRYRVLFDRGGIAEHMARLKASTDQSTGHTVDNDYHFGQFYTILFVGASRYKRGELLSGHQFIRISSLYHLLPLLKKHLPSENASVLDNLDPFRRMNVAYPDLTAELDGILGQPVLEAALGLLALVERELGPRVPDFPMEAHATVWGVIEAMRSGETR